MREIKFRAWHKSTGTMFNVHGWHSEFVFEDTLNGCGATETNPCKIEYCELMQFTGLKDKNGVDIYEGDIIEIFDDESTKGQVIFNEGSFRLYEKTTYYSHLSAYNPSGMCEIIGNIYENPDLLQSKNS